MTATLLHQQPEVHDKRWFLLGVLCTSLVMVVMAVSGLNVALPGIQRDLNIGSTTLQWIVNSYALVFAGLLLTAGAVGDRFGRKRALLVGVAAFGIGALVSGVAASASVIIVGRVLQGVGAALVMPATLSLITAVFPPDERGRAIAIWTGFAAAGAAIGPIVSGVLLERFWWGATFLVNLPVVIGVAVAITVWSPQSRDESGSPLDVPGAMLSLLGLGSLVFAIIEGSERGWSDVAVLASSLLAAGSLAGFVWWEKRSAHPMLPMGLFRDRRFSIGVSAITAVFAVMIGFIFLFSLLVQFTRGYSALATGIATLPLAIVTVYFSLRVDAITERIGVMKAIAAGFAGVGTGMALLAATGTGSPYLVFAIAMTILAAGSTVAMVPATTAIMSAVPPDKAGVGSAANDTAREVGAALGIAIFGSVANIVYRARMNLADLGIHTEAADSAAESIGKANVVAAQLDGELATAVAARAADAFSTGFAVTSGISSAVAILAAILVAGASRTAAPRPATSGHR